MIVPKVGCGQAATSMSRAHITVMVCNLLAKYLDTVMVGHYPRPSASGIRQFTGDEEMLYFYLLEEAIDFIYRPLQIYKGDYNPSQSASMLGSRPMQDRRQHRDGDASCRLTCASRDDGG